MKTRLWYSILLLVLAALQPAKAQEFDNDARLWLYIKLDKDLGKRWNAHLLLQNRLNNNVAEYSLGAADLGFTYKISKKLRVLADYVYGNSRRPEGTYSTFHQAYTGLVFRQKAQRFQFVYRSLVQARVKNVNASDKGGVPKVHWRNKLTVKYGLNKRFTFYAAQELNTPLYSYNDQLYISRSRTFVGMEHHLGKRSQLEGYFLFQRPFKTKGQAERDFIYGITYSHSF